VALVVALARLPRWLVLVPVAVVFALDAGFAWDSRIEAGRNVTFARMDADATAWVDRVVPDGARVAALSGGVPVDTRDALRLTEFFNGSIGPAYSLDGGYAPTLASDPVRVAAAGALEDRAGAVEADWVVAPRELELAGDVAAEGTLVGLRLWRVPGPVRVQERPVP
jgi:hypothetical protein